MSLISCPECGATISNKAKICVKCGLPLKEYVPKENDEIKTVLKLIKERKRVSQDLLKAHLGSSARATNILSELEIQGFITKPDLSNRWEIDFEKIDKYLEVVPQENKK
ncbi:MAG: zinc ribbon domain-containing protein [Elusimicrobia bacterium]|nr:zinc ribbon domain-containing protein [Elusimicrobiota bacterium]